MGKSGNEACDDGADAISVLTFGNNLLAFCGADN